MPHVGLNEDIIRDYLAPYDNACCLMPAQEQACVEKHTHTYT